MVNSTESNFIGGNARFNELNRKGINGTNARP
jgi:hypothetical protein